MPLLAALPSWRQNAVSTFDALGWLFATLSCYLCSQRINRHTDGIMVFFKGLRWTVLSDETHRGRSLGRYFVDPLMLYPSIIPCRIRLPSRG